MPEREEHIDDGDQAQERADTRQHPNTGADEHRTPRERTRVMPTINWHHAQSRDQLPRCRGLPAQKGHVIQHPDPKRCHSQDQLVGTRDQIGHAHRGRCGSQALGLHHGIEVADPGCVQRFPHGEGDEGDDRGDDQVIDHNRQRSPPP